VVVRVRVTNTGRRRGWAVPEVYVHVLAPPGLVQPPEQLEGVAKLSLAPGGHRTVRIVLDDRSFSYWNTSRQAFAVQPGCYEVRVGTSSRSLRLAARVPQRGARCR
jgi:beta-glucosidase